MKTLVRPAPFPEELDRGYLGRVMRINSYRCEKEILAAIAEDCGQEEKSAREFTTHERLSHIAGLSSEQFAQNHTTVPLRRAITSFFPEIRHGSLDRQSLLYNSAMQLRYPAAYFCPHCVEADIEFHGVSYWRRDHQTPGQLWCPKHQSALHFVSEGDPLMVPPAELINNAREVPGDWIEEARGNQYVDRFLAIAAEVFDQQAPFGVAAVVPMLREAGIAMGFQANAGTVKSALISDRICAVFPKRWLGVVFRDLVEKNEGQFLFQVDGALYMRKSSSSVTAYLLVLAILYSSADAALNALRAARDGTSRLVPTRQRDASLVVPEDEVLMEQYVLARGSYVAMMSALDIPRHRLAAKLAALGLPNWVYTNM